MKTTKEKAVQGQIQQSPAESGEIILYQPNENIRLEVRLDNGKSTVWLSIDQMAELFGRDRSVVGKHVRAVFNEGELKKESVWAKFAHTATDGKEYNVDFYNLDVIISVGYRVKSQQGTQFRIWATSVLREYLVRGYSVNRHLVALQQQVDSRFDAIESKVESQQQQVDFLIDLHKKTSDQIFPTGCVFDAWEHVARLVREAKKRIILIDNYCDERTLMLLSKRQSGVSCIVHTRYNPQFDADLEKHNSQYPKIEKIQLSQKEHDRFLIIDDTVYILGDSLKDLGHSLTTVLKTSFAPDEILELLKK